MAKNRRPYPKVLPNRFQKLLQRPWLYLFGSFSLAVLVAMILILKPFVIKAIVEKETQFKKGTEAYKKLVNITVPIFFKVRVFNITNPDALETGEKFKLEELGPYVYEEKRVKNVSDENLEEGTITFRETKTFTFRPDLSNGSEHDLITTINFPFLTALTISTRYLTSLSRYFVISPLESFGETLVMKDIPVGKLIFEGEELDPAYAVFTELNPRGYHKQFSDGKFAYFNKENNSDTGEFTYGSGVQSSSNFGQIIKWNGEKELNFWTNKSLPDDQQYCNKLNGSDGTLQPPFLTKDRTLYFFYTHLCRSMPLVYDKEITYEGIEGWQFTIPQHSLDSPSKNGDNQCFCQDPGGGLEKQCIDGIYRAFNCFMDAPLVISKPHFLDGAQWLIDGVEGLSPTRELHTSEVSIEPISGMFLKSSMKIQMAAEIQPFPGVMDDLPHVFVPLCWVEQFAYLDQHHVDFLMWRKVIPLRIAAWVEWTSSVLSGMMLVFGIYFAIRKTSRNPKVRIVELESINVTTTASD